MANELELWWELEPAVPFTCADGTAITKGSVVRLADPFTVAATTANEDLVIGVTKEDKIASNGITKTSVYMRGIFKATLSGTVSVGDPLGAVLGLNRLQTLDISGQTLSGQRCIGTALESTTDGQTGLVFINVQQVWPSI